MGENRRVTTKRKTSRHPAQVKKDDAALRHRINAGKAAVEEQIDFFKKQFGQVKSEWKEDDTRVTFADFAISEKIFAGLRRHFPEDDYCSEESNPQDEEQVLEEEYCWVLDPIDGTNNYALGMPIAAISLALLHKGHPVYGILYDSNRDLVIHGGPGYGVFENRNRLRPKFRAEADEHHELIRDFTIGLHFPVSQERIRRLEPLLARYRIRSLGSGALNLVYAAIGYYDGAMDFKVRVWDIAAAYALCLALERDFFFIDEAVFPLKRFHPKLPTCPYYAGSRLFCEKVQAVLADAPSDRQ